MTGFAEKLIAKDLYLSFRVDGVSPAGAPTYAYVAVQATKMQAFAEAIQAGGELRLEDYVTVLHAGEGSPSPEEAREIERKYGLNPHYVEDLLAAAASKE